MILRNLNYFYLLDRGSLLPVRYKNRCVLYARVRVQVPENPRLVVMREGVLWLVGAAGLCAGSYIAGSFPVAKIDVSTLGGVPATYRRFER